MRQLVKRFRCSHAFLCVTCVVTSAFLSTVILFEYLTYRCDQLGSRRSADPGAGAGAWAAAAAGPPSAGYDRSRALIFVGGWPRSGTTLMRAMLDAHPEVRCGEETHIIPPFLGLVERFRNSSYNSQRLAEAGVSAQVLLSASASFLLDIIDRRHSSVARLCNKDPLTAKFSEQLSAMFPSSQFVLMLRDGRAACHSVVSRAIGIGDLDVRNMTACLMTWSDSVDVMHSSCVRLGGGKCLEVRYEELVLHPRSVLERVLGFLRIPWDDSVLRHHEKINKPGGISVSRMEPSSDQIIKPVNLEALTKWSEFIPDEVKRRIRQVAPMLDKLGYDPDAYPPNYGIPDEEVLRNNQMIKNHEELYRHLAWEVLNQSKISPHYGSM